jgi:ornithine--oxo-acid transaminase
MTDNIYHSVYSSLERAIVHTSTFSENSLSMRAGLATLEVLEREELGPRALRLGEEFRADLREALAPFEIAKEVRGVGLLCGIEFSAPRRLGLRAIYEAFHQIHPAMFGQVLVIRMFREHNILTQICGNNFMVLKAAPPLVVGKEAIGCICGGDSEHRGTRRFLALVLDGSSKLGSSRSQDLTGKLIGCRCRREIMLP